MAELKGCFEILAFKEVKTYLNSGNAPDWWGGENKEIYDNLIFVILPAAFFDVYQEIGEPKKELERIKDYKEVIFWSFSRKNYQKKTDGLRQQIRLERN